jgi:hypothetical protein
MRSNSGRRPVELDDGTGRSSAGERDIVGAIVPVWTGEDAVQAWRAEPELGTGITFESWYGAMSGG